MTTRCWQVAERTFSWDEQGLIASDESGVVRYAIPWSIQIPTVAPTVYAWGWTAVTRTHLLVWSAEYGLRTPQVEVDRCAEAILLDGRVLLEYSLTAKPDDPVFVLVKR